MDVGGSTAGSIPIDARSIYEEGVRLPPVKLYRLGLLWHGPLQPSHSRWHRHPHHHRRIHLWMHPRNCRRRLTVRFPPVVPHEAVGDRNPDAHKANLYDIDAKYGDVVSVRETLDYLEEFAAAQAR